ncbi:hypothetical protein K9N68_19555 [Kovacikia minuta CCNUW1]|uniref:hypothetical protein n=1 Tax=Kovacikia minuta TaxID=2931930 RepID=UPI001CCF538C|nr:hypothetical protein [Kovacikia minuta]UBF23941.1 hypothetical protein K9N68_19555 [Kovacikia minuta CCNUW1]
MALISQVAYLESLQTILKETPDVLNRLGNYTCFGSDRSANQMEGRTSGGLEAFLRQVGRFQESCKDNSEKGHRVLITGRSLPSRASNA